MNIAGYLSNIKKFDWVLFIPVLLLVLFGLSSIYSMTINVENSNLALFDKQLLFSVIGFILLFLFSFLNYRSLKNYTAILYTSSVALLIAVLFFGQTIRGTTGWFSFWEFSFQPIELMKFTLVIVLAHFYHSKYKKFNWTKLFFLSGLITLVPVILAMRQPDFGSAFILIIIWMAFFLLLGLKKKQIILFVILILISLAIFWNFILVDYQKDRIMTFLDPGHDPLGRGYNVRQSIIAVGSGKLIGRGLGLGTQSQLRFLPEIATDFIYANVSESLGFLGSVMMVLFFAFLFIKLLLIIKNTNNSFGLYLVYGFGIIFFAQAIINIGMNIGLMPVTGLPLPFVSYGGSFLVSCLISMGLIESVVIQQK
ncbi:MAG: rod shape-determining protein RodA [Candidatus Kuenenbacteria bacterium]